MEISGLGTFHTNIRYAIWINDIFYMESDMAIQPIYGLKPDTKYRISLRNEEKEICSIEEKTFYEFVTLNVRAFGAIGDGVHDDTLAIQTAIYACPKDSRVYIPAGNYKVTSLFLKSNITIDLSKDAILEGTGKRQDYGILPGMIQSWDEEKEYNLGSWEGNPLDIFTSMITGINISNVIITGEGILDGKASDENWWAEDRKKIGAFRPRMIFLNHCQNVTIEGITVRNSPAWNIHPYFSDHVRLLNLKIFNPFDSPNTDGIDPESCNDVEITGVYFSVGDDCIAIKSGKLYMGRKYVTPCQNIDIHQCYMDHGHGAVTIGSEMAAGVYHLKVTDCIFTHTDRGLRIKTRRGRGKDAIVEDICFENIYMDHVLTPFVLNSFYNCCDPDRHSYYVKCKDPLVVDGRTPSVRQLIFKNIKALNCHVAGSFIYGLPEKKVDYLCFDTVDITYADDPNPDEPAMMDDIQKVARMGIFISNVHKLILKDVHVDGAEGKAFILENIDECEHEGTVI